MRLDVVASAVSDPGQYVQRQVHGLSGAERLEPVSRWAARAVVVALNRYQAIPMDVFAVVELVLREAKVPDSKAVAERVVEAIHAQADPVGILLHQRDLPPDGGLRRLLVAVRIEALQEAYRLLTARGRGKGTGSWTQAASAVHRLIVGDD